jgi:hypothetical protein
LTLASSVLVKMIVPSGPSTNGAGGARLAATVGVGWAEGAAVTTVELAGDGRPAEGVVFEPVPHAEAASPPRRRAITDRRI